MKLYPTLQSFFNSPLDTQIRLVEPDEHEDGLHNCIMARPLIHYVNKAKEAVHLYKTTGDKSQTYQILDELRFNIFSKDEA